MYKQLVPHFILEKSKSGETEGFFSAFSFFIDIAGFTSMTRNLMKNGKEGAEILSDILNSIFSACIDTIYENNGFISTFAGDAFIALFRSDSIEPVIRSVSKINEIFQRKGYHNTKFGEFHLSAKTGLSYGNIDWGIIKNEFQNTYYFRGSAISRCILCETEAISGEIIIDKYSKDKLDSGISLSKIKTGFYRLEKSGIPKKTILKKMKILAGDPTGFVHNSILHLKEIGEFREIIACFISFKDDVQIPEFLNRIINISHKFGGYYKDVMIGDKGNIIVVYFGAPFGIEKIFERAADFSLECKKNVHHKIKIGLTFGTVFTGFIENRNRSEYLALGEIVNLSARLCVFSEWDNILIDKSIYDQIKMNFETGLLWKYSFKGFDKKIPVYDLTGKRDHSAVVKTKDKIIGREKEIGQLMQFIKPLKEKFAGIIYVHGIAGIGKSRLVNEFRKKFIPVGSSKNIFIKELLSPKQETEYNWFYFPCDQILQTSFNPIIHFLKEYFDQSEKSSIKKNKDNFEKKFRMLIERVGDRSIKHELRRTKTILGSMINLYWKDSLYEQLDSKGRYQNVLYSFKNLIKAESTNKPTILEFEDCHWIDSDSRKMLETLTANVGDLPFVIISTCRIKDDGTKFNFNFKNIIENEIFLDSLPEKSSRDLISNILGGKISNRLFETIRSKSEGNPFYIEQILLYMQDNNLLEKEDTLIDIVSQIYSENLKIPSTINSIIIARIDKLTVELKELIKTASVLGREFVINVLVTMLRNKQISETLEEGIDENIWSSLSELLYIFKHSLIRETAYQMQLKKNLRKLHKIAAETIEELYRESLENHYTELADHYEKAEVPERAVDYLFKAGKQAKENYLNELAIDLLDRLLKNLKQLSNSEILEIDTLILQGDVLKLIGKWDLAEANFIRAQELSNKIKDKTRLGRSLLNLAEHYEKKGFYQDAMDYSNRCLELSQKINDHRGIAVAYCCIGSILTKKDEYAEAIKCFKKSLKNTRKSNNKKELNNILQSYGILLKKTGDYSKASEIYKRRIRISTEIGDEKALAYTLNNLGNIQTDQGEYDESEASFKKALEILTKLGDIYAIGMIIGNLGIIYMSQGKYEKSLKYFLKAISISREINDKVGIAINYGNAGIVYNRIGKNKKALECYKVRLEINHELGDRSGTALAHGNIGNVYIDSGKFIEANRSYEKMLSISKEIGFKIGIYYALANLAGGFAAMKEHDKSLRFFDEAIILGKELDLKDHLSQDLINKAELLFSLQKYSEAKLIVEEARKLTEKVMVDELIFKVMLLSAKIDFYSNNNLKKQKEIIETLRSYSENSEDQKEIAESNFELGNFCEHLDQIDDSIKHCKIAKDKYVILYKKTKYYKFKVKINFLDEKLKNR